MRRLVFVVAVIITPSFHDVARADDDPPFQCFVSPEAVLEAHPGSHAAYTAHATWWTESTKCWHVGKPVAKPTTKPRAAARDAQAPRAQALPAQLKQALPLANDRIAAVEETYEQATASLHVLMFGPDESPAGFEARFSAIGNTFSSWR